jgi:AcrR family transcriptional regulator
MVKRPESISKRAIDAAFELAAEKGWRRVALHEIAARAAMPLAEFAAAFPSKGVILVAFMRMIDEQVLENLDADTDEESPRDRLFGVMMKRFDALRPFKEGLAGMLRAPDGDLASFAAGTCRYIASMGLMLEAAGISSAGLRGRLRVQGLAALYPAVLRVWLNEDEEDMPRTMAALDRWLRNAEMIDQRLCGWSARPTAEPVRPADRPSPRGKTRRRRGGRKAGAAGATSPA